MGRWRHETGTSLIETMFACGILLVVTLGLLSLGGVAAAMTENHGHLAARTAEYAQDKMEQLLALKFGDAQSDTTSFPTLTSGGTGLAVGGSANLNAPVLHYTDYLDRDGKLLCPCTAMPPGNWFYKRAWQITALSATLKQVTVSTTVSRAVANAFAPRATLISLKSDPF
jgi:hypothetical protein